MKLFRVGSWHGFSVRIQIKSPVNFKTTRSRRAILSNDTKSYLVFCSIITKEAFFREMNFIMLYYLNYSYCWNRGWLFSFRGIGRVREGEELLSPGESGDDPTLFYGRLQNSRISYLKEAFSLSVYILF